MPTWPPATHHQGPRHEAWSCQCWALPVNPSAPAQARTSRRCRTPALASSATPPSGPLSSSSSSRS